MREVLFRGKLIDNGKWVQGYLYRFWDHAYILWGMIGGRTGDVPDMREVCAETVCQYTGLTDKNGRQIFEGDIVNCDEKRGAAFWRCKVVWNEVKARFDVIATDCAFPLCLDSAYNNISIDGLDYEVIGNIFDNPELIEGR